MYIHIIYFPFPAPVALADRVIFEIHRWVERIHITINGSLSQRLLSTKDSIDTQFWSFFPDNQLVLIVDQFCQLPLASPGFSKKNHYFVPFFHQQKKHIFFLNATPNLKFFLPVRRWRMPAMNWWSLPWATPMWAWPMRYAGSFWRRWLGVWHDTEKKNPPGIVVVA